MPTPTVTAHDESARGLGLASILEVVRRRRVLAVLPFLFVLATAASLAFFLPSLWTAKAMVLVNRQEIPEAYVKSTVSTELEARLLTLTHQILDTPRLTKIIQENNLYPAMRQARPMPDVIERMRRDIKIEVQDDRERRGREARSLVFTVAYTAADPTVAAKVTNTLAALFLEENRKMRAEAAVGTSNFLETQLRDLRTRLTAQEQKITAYKELHLGELPEQREVNLRTLERLQQQLQLAYENNRRANERRTNISRSLNDLDLASAMTAGGAAAASGLPVATPSEATAARLSLLRQELAALQTRYSDKYPDVISMKEQVRLAEARLDEEQKKEKKAAAASAAAAASPKTAPDVRGGSKASRDMRLAATNPYVLSLMQQQDQADVEAKASTDEIAGFNRQIGIYQRRLEMTPKREQELALITRDYETTRDMFKSMLAKRGEAEIAADLEQRQKGENFRVIEPAQLPERPVGPNRMRLLLVGLALGLGAAGVAVVLAEQVDTSYRRAEELRVTAGVPVFTTIPRIVTEADRGRSLRQRRLTVAAVAVGLVLVVGSSFVVAHNNQALVSVLSPDAGAKR